MRYAAFISYNHRDRRAAAWLHRALETYRIPRRLHGRASALGPLGARLPPVFRDREELSASADLAGSVRAALVEAGALIVICSPNGARSRWVNEEIRAFTALGRRDRIQCLIVDGEPNASHTPGGDPARECLPPALFEQGGSEPLASDIRPGQDGRAAARLKLLAGIMGIPFDELRQRDQARRQRRLMLVASASAMGFVAMAALALVAMVARADAIRQRDIARQKTATAERTVEFVKSLFEVSDPSEARGAKITAQEVLDRGADRIRRSLRDEPDVKAALMTTLSQVYLGLGSYRRGAALARDSLVLRVTDRGVRARQWAALAEAQSDRGDTDAAIRSYDRALLLARDPERGSPALAADILAGRSGARTWAGDVAGGLADATQALRLDRAQRGARSVAVARDLEMLGQNRVEAGDYPRARDALDRALTLRIGLQGATHPKVSSDLNDLGGIAYRQGDSAAAERYFRRALASDLVVLGPRHPEVAVTLNNIARLLLEQRRFGPARDMLQRAVAISEQQNSPDLDVLAYYYTNLAIADRHLSAVFQAEEYYAKALRVAIERRHRNLGPILIDIGTLRCERGDARQGLLMLRRAAPLIEANYAGEPWRSAWLQNAQGFCLSRAGQALAGRTDPEQSDRDCRTLETGHALPRGCGGEGSRPARPRAPIKVKDGHRRSV